MPVANRVTASQWDSVLSRSLTPSCPVSTRCGTSGQRSTEKRSLTQNSSIYLAHPTR